MKLSYLLFLSLVLIPFHSHGMYGDSVDRDPTWSGSKNWDYGDVPDFYDGDWYKIENKWHRDQGKLSSLDAYGDNDDGLICRSGGHHDNTFWYISSISNGSWKIENKWHRDRGKPASLDAYGDHNDGLIFRTGSHNDNTFWYISRESNGSWKIENKWHRDRGKPASLDAYGDHSEGLIFRAGSHTDNSFWYITRIGSSRDGRSCNIF